MALSTVYSLQRIGGSRWNGEARVSDAIKSLGQFAWWLPIAILTVPVIWVIFRSGSFFPIDHLFWKLSHPEKQVSDPRIQNAIRQRADLIAFRATLMRADHVPEMSRLLDWAKQYEIDIGTVGECGRYFHRQDLKLKGKIFNFGAAKGLARVGYVAVVLLFISSVSWASQSQLLLWFSDDHTLFYLSKDSAQLFHSKNLSALVPKDCPKLEGWGGFNAIHTKVICEVFQGNDLPAIIESGVRAQRILGLTGIALSLFLFFWIRRKLTAVRSAHAVRSWLNFKSGLPAEGDGTHDKHP